MLSATYTPVSKTGFCFQATWELDTHYITVTYNMRYIASGCYMEYNIQIMLTHYGVNIEINKSYSAVYHLTW